MQLQDLNIEGFGTLAQYKLSDLSDGINVIYGGNGSGKSTILHFLRGVLCGFQDARRLRLIPPLRGGHPGGSLRVRAESGTFDVIRHARPDQSDTLAIHSLQSAKEDVAAVRKWISRLNASQLSTVFAVSSYEAHDLPSLVRQALNDGIDLTTRRQSGHWVADRLKVVEQERADLLGEEPSRSPLAELEAKLRDIDRKIAEAHEQESRSMTDWSRFTKRLDQQLEQLRQESNRLAAELQAAETDLTEVQTRLWSSRTEVVFERRTVEIEEPPAQNWPEEITQIDREIANAQQVLRDLATSRMSLSIKKADLTGSETPDQESVLKRQRSAIEAIETQANLLEDIVAQLTSKRSDGVCVCHPLAEEISGSLESIRSQIWLMCQELSRQQVAHEQGLISNSRNNVDQCEVELIRQIQRLRSRRDELVHHHTRSAQERVMFRTSHESGHCGCADHEGALTYLPLPKFEKRTRSEVVSQEQLVELSDARPGDASWANKLLAEKASLQQQLRRTQEELNAIHIERLELNQHPQVAFEKSGLRQLRFQKTQVEQQLADAREQWESLALLRATLKRTRDLMEKESSSPALEEASRLLSRMTNQRYSKFVFDKENTELRVVNAADAELRASALSRGTLEQAVLCFRLALWSEYRRQGLSLPLVLDDVLADSDEDRVRLAAEVLIEEAGSHQMILMTCQEHLIDLFESMGIRIRCLPGSVRSRFTPETPARTPSAPKPAVAKSEPVLSLDRIQPDEPYWLSADSAVNLVPSLGSQMSRRLGALGVRTVADLIELDLEATELPIDSLQISAKTLRLWQSEARLLCCVPGLTGRDAQLLVAIGIYHPAELAQADLEDLLGRIRRFRTMEKSDLSLTWLNENFEWPGRTRIEEWITRGHAARTYRSSHRQTAVRAGRVDRKLRRLRGDRVHNQVRIEPVVRLHSTTDNAVQERTLRFFLHAESPIVDAPSIGPKTAERLQRIGISTVRHLLERNARDISSRLNRRHVTDEIVVAWQQQASLMCRIPELRGHDVQILIACGLTEPNAVAAMTPADLFAVVRPLAVSKEGQRLLRSSKTPDLAEVTEWIEFAQHARTMKAA